MTLLTVVNQSVVVGRSISSGTGCIRHGWVNHNQSLVTYVESDYRERKCAKKY